MDGRCMSGCTSIYSSYAHGTKGSAIVSKSGDCGAPSTIFSGQKPDSAKKVWQSGAPSGQGNPYQNEWEDLIDAIRDDKPYNEAHRGAKASLVTSMGRMAAHTGRIVKYNDILNCQHEFAPDVDKFTMDSPPPLQHDDEGNYPWPMPGIKTDREY
jgi:hypothetical protein